MIAKSVNSSYSFGFWYVERISVKRIMGSKLSIMSKMECEESLSMLISNNNWILT